MLQVFDDGSTVQTDDVSGVVVSVTDKNGVPQPVAQGGGAIVQQFAQLFNYGVRSVLDAKYRPAVAPATQTGTVQSLTSPSLKSFLLSPLGLIVAAGLLYFALKRAG